MFEDTKWVIKSRKSKKYKQYNGQRKKTDNTMAKGKRQTIQWRKEKDKQYNGERKKG